MTRFPGWLWDMPRPGRGHHARGAQCRQRNGCGGFLSGQLGFMDIPKTVEATMEAHQPQPLESLEQVLAVNRWAGILPGHLSRGASRGSLIPDRPDYGFSYRSIQTFMTTALATVIVLGVLVFVHELGHFLMAKLFGVRVDAFSLGFPPKVLHKQIGETDYRLSVIPLGGYVKLFGKIPRMKCRPSWSRCHFPITRSGIGF